ncbi:MAG: hypothetical protein Q4Q23_03025 [Methanobacteriaceae archaeon]|nr:hypothetical protein [Methanobacteriaceae archaeon]
MNYSNIYKTNNNNFFISKNFYGHRIYYGTFNNLTEAIKKRDLLIKYDWIKCKNTGYSKDSFYEYNIIKKENNYYLINKDNKEVYGPCQCYKFIDILKNIIPYYTPDININLAKKMAIKEFYKNISYNKLHNSYIICYKGKHYGVFSKLSSALKERDLLKLCDCDEDIMCEYTELVYEYDKDILPKYPYKQENNIEHEYSLNKHHRVRKKINGVSIHIGSYSSYDQAKIVREYLDDHNWDMKIVKHIRNISSAILYKDRYINKKGNKYYVSRIFKGKYLRYGSYDTIQKARYIRDMLISNNWNIEKIDSLKVKNNNYLDYCDSTDILEDFI